MVEIQSPQGKSPPRHRQSCAKGSRNECEKTLFIHIDRTSMILCVFVIIFVALLFKSSPTQQPSPTPQPSPTLNTSLTVKHVLKPRQYHWGDFQRSSHCHSFATRLYTANLWNVAPGEDVIAACRRTPMLINGQHVLPSECEDRVSIVDF